MEDFKEKFCQSGIVYDETLYEIMRQLTTSDFSEICQKLSEDGKF